MARAIEEIRVGDAVIWREIICKICGVKILHSDDMFLPLGEFVCWRCFAAFELAGLENGPRPRLLRKAGLLLAELS